MYVFSIWNCNIKGPLSDIGNKKHYETRQIPVQDQNAYAEPKSLKKS